MGIFSDGLFSIHHQDGISYLSANFFKLICQTSICILVIPLFDIFEVIHSTVMLKYRCEYTSQAIICHVTTYLKLVFLLKPNAAIKSKKDF